MRMRYALPSLMIGTLLIGGCGGGTEPDAVDQQPAAAEAPSSQSAGSPASTTALLDEEVAKYRQYVVQQCDTLVKETEKFTDAVKAGDLEKAKSLYAPTRMYYERIEPIAEALGDLDPNIDARENDVEESEWRGFHRIEKGLWEANSTKGLEQFADQLLNDVKLLRAKVETVEIDAGLLVTGSVELLNEVSSSKVTGEEERYSHTDLYDFVANVEGAKQIFEVLKPPLQEKDADLVSRIDSRFADLEKAIEPYRKGEGFVLYTELSKDETKTLSQAIDALAEPLSQMGTVLGE